MSDAAGSNICPAIALESGRGWRVLDVSSYRIWHKDYGTNPGLARLLNSAGALSGRQPEPSIIESWLSQHHTHFALVIQAADWTFAAVDPVRSIPLAFASDGHRWHIDDRAARLAHRAHLTDIDPQGALALAMAGYSVGEHTLLDGVHQLGPGEYVVLRADAPPLRRRYHTYKPWLGVPGGDPSERVSAQLEQTLLGVVDEMMRSVGDRTLLVPLSAGRDSRAIVSAARHLGHDNIRTFAYGHPGNHEARASEAIATRLGYPWRFVPIGLERMRRHYASSTWRDYADYADTLQATPFVQDLAPLQDLQTTGYIPDDAVLCNGNSGDYISGGHVPPAVWRMLEHGTDRPGEDTRILQGVVRALYDKHFALWQDLATASNRERIEAQLQQALAPVRQAAQQGEPIHGLYEFAEFQDRQSKYVINGQRVYDFLGYEWRLPLWHRHLLDFFETLAPEHKYQQQLYADTLTRANWGGVWSDIPINKKDLRPHWIRPLRTVAKLAHAPLGRRRWHQFERRYIQYFTEQGSQSAIRRYRDVARDTRGARHGVAWLTEAYLARHGLNHDGTRQAGATR